MFWVALASLIMMLSGDGDDRIVVARFLDALAKSAQVHVKDPARLAEVLDAVHRYERTFEEHRDRQNELAGCLEKADRKYQATAADYDACKAAIETHWINVRAQLDDNRARLERNLTPAEVDAIGRDLLASTDAATVVEKGSHVKAPGPPPRRRGLEGFVAQRKTTVPRNTLTMTFGPGLVHTFGVRFPAGSIEAGTLYRREEEPLGVTSEQWMMRAGVLFGLFDDIEAGALFLPIELSPDPHFDDVTVLLTKRWGFGELDVAARLSFRTPGEIGWALNPGVLARYQPSPRLALDAAFAFPVELGSFKKPLSPTLGVNVPLRATWNVTHHLFVLGTTGFAVDDVSTAASAVLPLGGGAGYTLLLGKRLLDLTAVVDWDGFARFAPAATTSALDAGSYRVSFGINVHQQAL